ncbi:Methyltransferase domain-containing protein [Ruegeria halocynthiae]|uniref:Methyltransferase domain-containing protein n=1 Tax=Ruegeria halocynthiae TaxID=985054 RepID=A0A1H2UTM3_9RHOB|nr:class I SAM-dependent methyltransferase [Ruegeria halocynthiae]SDW59415.1 Methyltransferase domain-containing protein [Ruegeria halocynthiae]
MAEPASAEERRKQQAKQRERKDALRREMLKTMPHGKLSVEIGVWRGEFSQILLEELSPSKLCLIDPWGVQPDPDGGASLAGARSQDDMDRIYDAVKDRYSTEIAKGQVSLIRDFSIPALRLFEDQSIGFAYLDGDHSYQGVKADLEALLPKMIEGGVIMLDDYHRRGWWKDGVMRAFHEFLGANSANLRLKAIKGAQVAVQKL